MYGLEPEDFEWLRRKFANKCGVCDTPIAGKNLHVDHDHKTGHVRGLLCQTCNQGLGNFGDDVWKLKRAILYLENTAILERKIGAAKSKTG